MSTPAERVQRFLGNYEGTEIITSVRRQPPGCSCPVPLRLSDLRSILADLAAVPPELGTFLVEIDEADGTW